MHTPSETLGPVLLDGRTIRNRIDEMGVQITRDYAGRVPHLVGILKGACIFHADLARAIDLPVSFDFIAAASYGSGDTSSGEVRLRLDLEESPEGRHILLVEDIVDTGLTLHSLVRRLEARKPESLKIIALLNKPARRRIEVPLDYVGFDIPDAFVVGYGLDYDQRYRNLQDIRVLRLCR